MDLVEELEAASLLPAIVFIFSRAACDDAARQTAEAGIRFTTRAERARLRAVAERRVDELTDAELDVLGYHAWVSGLEAGVAAHHAGMVPAFRETVEEAFAAGLLRVVYATETLSLGINMPARTVVLERFSKWGPAGRADLTSGDYLQLTGRAGRRGLDRQGHAVVLWSPGLELARVAAVATGRPPALRSAFRPTYNLAANLVRRFDRPRALDVLRRSFGQWQATHLSGGSPEHLTQLFSRRLSVLEELGFLRGWSLTRLGERLSRIYHEADIVVAQLLEEGHLGSDPAVLAGLLSALVYEPRRDRRPAGRRAGRPAGGRRGGAPARSRRRKGSDRLGERRLQELGQRAAELRRVVEVTRAVEEVHRVPPVRRPAPELGPAVATWVRGGTLGEVLDAAGRSGVELAPGDFVRMAKQLGDLLGQVAVVGADGGDPGAAGAASAAFPLLVRGVVAASGTAAGGEVEEAPETVEPGPEASTTRSRARS